MKYIVYKINNGIRHGERKTLDGAKALAEKFRKTCRNHVCIYMVYFDEESQCWKSEQIQ
jgi:hypothetical protein